MAYRGKSSEIRRYSPAVEVTNGYTSSTDRWIKIATYTGGANMHSSSCLLLVHMGGPEITGTYDREDTFFIRAKYTAYSSAPYNFSGGTNVVVDQLNHEIKDFDPTTDLAMAITDTMGADLWIKSSASYGRCYVTHLGGSDREDGGQYEEGEWVIPEPHAWAVNYTSGETDVMGKWAAKSFEDIKVVGDDPRIKVDADRDAF